jgi:hypothetical protein
MCLVSDGVVSENLGTGGGCPLGVFFDFVGFTEASAVVTGVEASVASTGFEASPFGLPRRRDGLSS